MRITKERKPILIKDGKAIYNLGFIDYYQKPWFIVFDSNIEYYGRFAEEGYPGKVQLEFDPLKKLIEKIRDIDPRLKTEIFEMIEELQDAHYAEKDSYIRSLPSAD